MFPSIDNHFGHSVCKLGLRDEDELSPVNRMSMLDEPQDGHLHVVACLPPAGELVLVLYIIPVKTTDRSSRIEEQHK
jgi:hypothetical protein